MIYLQWYYKIHGYLNGTIKENIKYNQENVTDERVIRSM